MLFGSSHLDDVLQADGFEVGVVEFHEVLLNALTSRVPYQKNSSIKVTQKSIKSQYFLRYILLTEVLQIGVDEGHEGVLECSGHHGTIFKQFLIPNCT